MVVTTGGLLVSREWGPGGCSTPYSTQDSPPTHTENDLAPEVSGAWGQGKRSRIEFCKSFCSLRFRGEMLWADSAHAEYRDGFTWPATTPSLLPEAGDRGQK